MENNKKNPFLSVVMPVYNSEKYLKVAIQSVLKQTYTNFEFFIINDGSTDQTASIINKFAIKDKRIKPIHIKKQGGISNAMNIAIRKAKGVFIARADGDDICLLNRFEKQVNYLLAHPKVDILGTYFCLFFNGKVNECKVVPASVNDVYNGKPPVHHPTCLIKRNVSPKYGIYNSRYDNAEDVELWFRWFSQGVKFDNIPEVLYKKRIHEGCVSIAKIKHQTYLLLRINFIAITKYRIRFTIQGYLRILEQFLYLLYLTLRLDRIYKKNN